MNRPNRRLGRVVAMAQSPAPIARVWISSIRFDEASVQASRSRPRRWRGDGTSPSVRRQPSTLMAISRRVPESCPQGWLVVVLLRRRHVRTGLSRKRLSRFTPDSPAETHRCDGLCYDNGPVRMRPRPTGSQIDQKRGAGQFGSLVLACHWLAGVRQGWSRRSPDV